jgi:hypothetical protein
MDQRIIDGAVLARKEKRVTVFIAYQIFGKCFQHYCPWQPDAERLPALQDRMG